MAAPVVFTTTTTTTTTTAAAAAAVQHAQIPLSMDYVKKVLPCFLIKELKNINQNCARGLDGYQ
jgi:hypothetical protein